MIRIKSFLLLFIFFVGYFSILFNNSNAQQDSVVVMLMRVDYDAEGQKNIAGAVSSTIFLEEGPSLPIEFKPSLTFGSAEAKEKDYRNGSTSSEFQTYFDLKNLIDPFPFKRASRKTTPFLIYNCLIKPERLTSDKIHVKLAYEKNEFIEFSKDNNPTYEKSFFTQEFNLNLEVPRELFVVSTAPHKTAVEIVIQNPIRPPIESKISTAILEKLVTLKPIEIPVNFHIEYVRKDKSNNNILFRKQTDQQGFSRENPFCLDYLVESPEVFRQNDKDLNYTIRGHFVPIERKKDELKLFLVMEQLYISTPGGHSGHRVEKEMWIKKGEKLEIELMTSSGVTGFKSKSGDYISFEYNELFKGSAESLFLTADF